LVEDLPDPFAVFLLGEMPRLELYEGFFFLTEYVLQLGLLLDREAERFSEVSEARFRTELTRRR
jgi:hypothetical protein